MAGGTQAFLHLQRKKVHQISSMNGTSTPSSLQS
jgi:hypothetical protein